MGCLQDENTIDPDSISYIKHLHHTHWVDSIAAANAWILYGLTSHSTKDGRLYEGQIFQLNTRLFML